MNFTFNIPTKIFFGANCILTHCSEFAIWGRRPLIVTGKSSAKKSGALADVQTALTSMNMQWHLFDQIEENPSFSTIEAGAIHARTHNADMIIGIGGGSPLDAAKAIAALAVHDFSVDSLFDGPFKRTPLPVVAVPLTAGTGSEVTPYSVLTDRKRQTKRSLSDRSLFPRAAFLDARYTLSLSKDATINTAVDALSHAIEGFLSRKSSEMSDMFALEALRSFRGIIQNLSQNTLTLTEREQLLFASLLSGIVIAQTGTTMIHPLGYSLTYFRSIPHGRANGLLLAESLRFMQEQASDKITTILKTLDFTDLNTLKTTMRLLVGAERPLTAEERTIFINKALQAANIANTPKIPDAQDLERILIDSFINE
jgi:alcohol dehydrogenase class IV